MPVTKGLRTGPTATVGKSAGRPRQTINRTSAPNGYGPVAPLTSLAGPMKFSHHSPASRVTSTPWNRHK